MTEAFISIDTVQIAAQDELSLLHFIFIAISMLGFGIGVYLLYRKGLNTYMGIFTISVAAILLELTFLWWDGIMHIPKIPFYSSLLFLLGPCIYLYLEKSLYPHRQIRLRSIVLLFGPFFLSLILLLILTNSIREMPLAGTGKTFVLLLNNIYIKIAYFGLFLIILIRRYQDCRFQLDELTRKWTLSLIIFLAIICFIFCFQAVVKNQTSINNILQYTLAYFFSAFIIIISFLLFLLPKNITEILTANMDKQLVKKEKYQNSGLTQTMIETLRVQLLEAMEEKPYLDNTLSLQDLADKLNTDRYSLSQVINQEFNKNFYEFINDYRINECITIIENSPKRVELITDLIYESGFNNKVSFYKAFKKRKHLTPVQYIKNLQK